MRTSDKNSNFIFCKLIFIVDFIKFIWSWVKPVDITKKYYLLHKNMKHYHIIICPYCKCEDLVKNGHSENNTQRWKCNCCDKSFQLEYTYNAYKPGIKEKIEEMTINSSGVRDISRTLKISKNTIISELKKKNQKK